MAVDLWTIPSDVLAMITFYLRAENILALIVCGDKQLNKQLTIGGGVKELEFYIFPWRSILWSPLASTFPFLRLLSYKLRSNRTDCRVTGVNLDDAPNTLKTLRLEFPGSLDSFFYNPHGELLQTPLPTIHDRFPHLTELEIAGRDSLSGHLIFNLLSPVSTLLHLSLIGHFDASEPEVINSLPRSLTWLQILSLEDGIVTGGLPRQLAPAPPRPTAAQRNQITLPTYDPLSRDVDFPPHLTFLTLRTNWALAVSHRFPESLTTLKSTFASQAPRRQPDELKYLPKGLTSLTATISTQDPQYWSYLPHTLTQLQVLQRPSLNDDILAALPPNLTETNLFDDVRALPDSSIRLIPRHVESVGQPPVSSIALLRRAPVFIREIEFFESLPPTLRHLTGGFNFDDPDQVRCLPQTLISLGVGSLKNPEVAAALPRGLRSLICLDATELKAPIVRALPESLFSITLQSSPPFEFYSALNKLTCLESLEINSRAQPVPPPIPGAPAQVLPAAVAQAPMTGDADTQNTVSHEISSSPPTSSSPSASYAAPQFPSSLTHFVVKDASRNLIYHLGHLDRLKLLVFLTPRSSLSRSSRGSSTQGYVPKSAFVHPEDIDLLPKTLAHISLILHPSISLSEVIRRLPCSLKTLNLKMDTSGQPENIFSIEDVKVLPRTLTSLSLPQCVNFPSEFFVHLPKRVTSVLVGETMRLRPSDDQGGRSANGEIPALSDSEFDVASTKN